MVRRQSGRTDLHAELSEFLEKLDDAVGSLTQITAAGTELADLLGLAQDVDFRLKDAQQLAQFAIRLVNAPSTDLTRIVDPGLGRTGARDRQTRGAGASLGSDALSRTAPPARRFSSVCLARVSPASEHPCRGVKRASPLTVDESRGLSALLLETIDSLLAVLSVAG